MKRQWSRWMTCAVVGVALHAAAAAEVRGQSGVSAAVVGRVSTPAGGPLGQALVTLRDEETGVRRSVRADRDGDFRFTLLPPGSYELRVEQLGYRPLLIAGVRVVPGADVVVRPILEGLGDAPIEAAERAGAGAPGATGADWLAGWAVRQLPHRREDALELARLTARAAGDGGLEGLPSWYSALALDGVRFRPAGHPLLREGGLAATAFGLAGVGSAQLLTLGLDTEWAGAAGGWVSLHSRRGTTAVEVDGRGGFSGTPLPGPSFGTGLDWNDAVAGLALRAPLAGGQDARISAGVRLRRFETPMSRSWGDSPAAVRLSELGEATAVDFAALRRATVSPAEAVTGFARVDWQLTDVHAIALWAHAAAQPHFGAAEARLGALQDVSGGDVVAGGHLVSTLGETTYNDARAFLTRSTRRTTAAAVGPTWIVSDALALGGIGGAVGEEVRVGATNALHVRRGRHALKLGAGLTIASHRYDYRRGAEGEVYFGSADDLLARSGYEVRVDGGTAFRRWTSAQPALFVQDRLDLGSGLSAIAGMRAELVTIPQNAVARDAEWERLTGIANDEARHPGLRPEARVGLSWDVREEGRWVLTAGAGTYGDEIDPLLLAEWQVDDGSARVRRGLDQLSWPDGPHGSGLLRRVTVLAPGFTAPRTLRGAVGVFRRLGDGLTVHAEGVVRRTENLPRRSDLNLLPQPALHDQHGRPVFGTPQQTGALLLPEPGSGRRFAEYDEAAGITADGWSEHAALSVGLERQSADGLSLLVSYTFSRTRDNWFGGRAGGWTVAAPSGLDTGRDWVEGTSDFDVPHRAVVAASLPIAGRVRLGTVYRLESGLPFTPGFRRGVDASADGYADNDPAFVDLAHPGMQELVASWPCLSASAGRFAARNSCRGDMRTGLDASLTLDLVRFGRATAAVRGEAFDLLEGARSVPDAALWLIDPDGTTVVDAANRSVTLPLQLNPSFGAAVLRPQEGRTLRIGLQVSW